MRTGSPSPDQGVRFELPTEPYMAAVVPSRSVPGSELSTLGIGLLLLPLLVLLRDLWPARLVALVVLLVVPGVLLLRLLRFSGRPLAVLTVPSSLVVLLFSGLAVTLLGPVLGVERPLRPLPQLVGIELVGIVLIGVLAYNSRWRSDWLPLPLLSRLPPPTSALPLLLPLVAIAGAQRLNSGSGGVVAVTAVVLGFVVLGAVVLRAPRLSDGTVATTLYAVGLSSLYSFSLRAEAVYGYDSATEFRKMAEASTTGAWRLLHLNDAYGAMLSVTVLPAQLEQVTGTSLEALIQLVYPALFALAPTIVFFTARTFLDRRWALVGAAVVVAQANFGQQLPGLARQEIGLLLFAAVLYVLVVTIRLDARAYGLLVLLSAAMVVSHYSTAYLTVMIFVVSLLLVGAAAVVRKEQRQRALALLVTLVAVAGGAALWNGVLTRSTSNVGSIVSGLTSDGLQLLPNRGGNSLLTYVSGTVTPELSAAEYQQVVDETYAKDRSYVAPFPDGADPANDIQGVAARPDSGVVDAAAVMSFVLRQLIYLAAIVGALSLLLFRFPGRTSPDSMWIVGGLNVGVVLVLALIRVSGTLAASYNQDRALLHALLVLAVGVGWCGQAVAKSSLLSRSQARLGTVLTTTVAGLLALQLAISSSLVGLAAGAAGINLSNHSEDAQRFFVHRSEVLAAEWLGQRIAGQGLIYADRYAALRIILATGRYQGVLSEMVPSVIDRNAWIYLSTTNLEDGAARSETDGKFGIYRYPQRFLNEHFDVVYSNGQSEVMHR